MKLKVLLLTLMIFICSFSVNANTDWSTIGNYGSSALIETNTDIWYYSSNYPYGSYTNFTNIINITGGWDYEPYIVDLNNDGNNEIYMVEDNRLYVYNHLGEFITYYRFNDNIRNYPVPTTYDDENYIVVYTENDFIHSLTFTDDGNIEKERSVNVSGYKYQLTGYYGASRVVLLGDDDCKNVFIYDFEINQSDVITATKSDNDRNNCRYRSSSSSNTLIYDINRDGNQDLLICGMYNDLTDEYIIYCDLIGLDEAVFTSGEITSIPKFLKFYEKTQSSSKAHIVDNVGLFNLGYKYSDNEISILVDQIGGTGNNNHLFITNLNDDDLFFSSLGVTSNIFSCDWNKDGQNELGLIYSHVDHDNSTIRIYDYLYNLINEYSTTNDSIRGGNIVCGEYDNSNIHLELLTNNKIYSYNGSDWNDVYNLTNSNTYPVILGTKNDYIKDLVGYDSGLVTLYLNEETGADCGNGICEEFESILNCPGDCLEDDALDYEDPYPTITEITVNPSPDEVWLQNTRVSFRVCAKGENLEYLYPQVSLYDGETFEQKSIVKTMINEQCVNFDYYVNNETLTQKLFKANVTGSYNININVDAYRGDEVYSTSTIINFNVDNETGISYGENIKTGEPFDFTSESFDATTDDLINQDDQDPNSNALLKSLNDWAGLFGISASLGYWFIIFLVIFGIISQDVKAGKFSNQTFGVISLVFIIMLWLGLRIGLISLQLIILMGLLSAIPIYLIVKKFLPQ